MSRGTADNRATADDALMRYADILDGRKRLATFGIKGAFCDGDGNPEDFLFYKNENGHLPPEIESAFTCACDALRKAGHSPTAEAIANLHGQLAERFAEAAGRYRDAVFVYGNCQAFLIRVSRDRDALLKGPDPEEPPTSDKAAHALWEQTMDRRNDEAFIKLYDIYGSRLFDRYTPFFYAEKDFELLRKSLEECFEQNAAVVRGIVKAGVRDIRGEQFEQIIAGIRLVNQAQAETKQAVVGVRDDVRELKPEIVRGANAAESADANAAAAKTAAEGAKESAEGAEQVAKESKSLVEIVVAGIDKAVNLIRACLAPRSVDCEVTIEQLSAMLAAKGLESGTGVRLIQLWEQYLKSGGAKGTQPPDGYTLATRQTLASATAWVEYHVAHKKSRLKTGETFNEVSARHNASRIADNAPKPRRGE